MELIKKLEILTDSAKYDVACTSSGSERGKSDNGGIGSTIKCGICHSFSADGRCISLLKVLMTNYCIYDCKYCINRISNDIPRTAFTPEELSDLVIGFYKRNYIEGLFLSSAVLKNPDYTMEQMCVCIGILRNKYKFNGYIHAKAIPGASPELIQKLGTLVDRISVNLELPSEKSLNMLAPNKPKESLLKPMAQIKNKIIENKNELALYNYTPTFAPAGQSTQMIIGATPDTDYQIVRLSESLYKKYNLKRVFYSAYIPVGDNSLIPRGQAVPLLREHRLYQADWLLRFYNFKAEEILNEENQNLDPLLDPKCNWAINNLDYFPVEINSAEYETLLRVPGIGQISARKIIAARRVSKLDFNDLKKMGVVLKRAIFFITCDGKYSNGIQFNYKFIHSNLTADTKHRPGGLPFFGEHEQLEFALPQKDDYIKSLTGQI